MRPRSCGRIRAAACVCAARNSPPNRRPVDSRAIAFGSSECSESLRVQLTRSAPSPACGGGLGRPGEPTPPPPPPGGGGGGGGGGRTALALEQVAPPPCPSPASGRGD